MALLKNTLPLLALLAYVAAFRGRLTSNVLTRTPIVMVGGMCYTLYLYHFFIISFVGRFSLPRTLDWGYLPSVAVQSVLIVPVVIIAGAFMIWRPGQKAANAHCGAVPQNVGVAAVPIAAAATGLDMEGV
jgi:peptidoglycan/LPS O-acetylase OafA/YrhL